jgi:hypothetical protein
MRTSSQRRLARCCTNYITKSIVPQVDRTANASQSRTAQFLFILELYCYPLLKYAIKHMSHHAAEGWELITCLDFNNKRDTDCYHHRTEPYMPIQSYRAFRSKLHSKGQSRDRDTIFLSSSSSNLRVYFSATYTTQGAKNFRIFCQDEFNIAEHSSVHRQKYGFLGYIHSVLDLPGHASFSKAQMRPSSMNPAAGDLSPLT